MMVIKRLASVAPEVNLGSPWNADNEIQGISAPTKMNDFLQFS